MSTHMCFLVLAAGGGGGLRSDCRIWFCLCCVYREHVGGWWAIYGYSGGDVRGDIEFGEKEARMHESLLLVAEEGSEMRSN